MGVAERTGVLHVLNPGISRNEVLADVGFSNDLMLRFMDLYDWYLKRASETFPDALKSRSASPRRLGVQISTEPWRQLLCLPWTRPARRPNAFAECRVVWRPERTTGSQGRRRRSRAESP